MHLLVFIESLIFWKKNFVTRQETLFKILHHCIIFSINIKQFLKVVLKCFNSNEWDVSTTQFYSLIETKCCSTASFIL
jgi:hypothetical protein